MVQVSSFYRNTAQLRLSVTQLVISSCVDEICTETVSTHHILRGLKHLRLSDIPFSWEHPWAALSTLQRFVRVWWNSSFPKPSYGLRLMLRYPSCQWASGENKQVLPSHISNPCVLSHSPIWEVPGSGIYQDGTVGGKYQNSPIWIIARMEKYWLIVNHLMLL